jgi:hypothetical protein
MLRLIPHRTIAKQASNFSVTAMSKHHDPTQIPSINTWWWLVVAGPSRG